MRKPNGRLVPVEPVVLRNGARNVLFKSLAVGIFVFENLKHIENFETEVQALVKPAMAPLNIGFAYAMHALTILLGLSGSAAFILSGFSKHERKILNVSTNLLGVFMIIITWNWWLRRYGTFVWRVEDDAERRMRTIHCLKNLSIFGLILTIGRIVSELGHRAPHRKKE